MTTTHECEPISPLVAAILERNSRDLAHTTNTLIDSLTSERDKYRAELRAIRTTIIGLLDGPYHPSAAALEAALYPGDALIDLHRTERDPS